MKTDDLLDSFEEAWRSGHVPDVASELSSLASAELPLAARRTVIGEFIMIDLWHRWQRTAANQDELAIARKSRFDDRIPPTPVLEDYVKLLPDVLSLETFSPDVIGEEYRARRRFGDQPSPEDYQSRFPAQWNDVKDLMTVLDTDATTAHTAVDSMVAPSGEIPSQIGKYLVLEMVDRGGQARLFRGVHPELRSEVAIKLGHTTVPDLAANERLVSEARLMVQLNHPHLIKVHDLGFHEGQPYIVMDYVPGRSLAHYTMSQPITPRDAATIIVKLADALNAIHARGITHNDIKPANVLMNEKGEPILVDFGLASNFVSAGDEEAAKKSTAGTLSFMAPEQAKGESLVTDVRTDVFALGATLYFLLAGKPPFRGKNVADLLEKVKHNAIDVEALSASNAPPAARRICLKAMSARPEDRYTNPQELATDLNRWLNRKPLPVIATAMCVALLVVLTSLAFWYAGADDEGDQARPEPENPAVLVLERPAKHDFPFAFAIVGHDSRGADAIALVDGETMAFRIQADRDCYVGIWHIDGDGAATQLFPNDFDQDGFVEANVAQVVPDSDDYAIRLTSAEATEYIYAAASTEAWETMVGTKSGPYSTFSTPDQIARWKRNVRGAELIAHRGARIAEVVIAINVSEPPRREQQPPAVTKPNDTETETLLAERAELIRATESARANGQIDDAIRLAEQVLEIEVSLFGERDPAVPDTIKLILDLELDKHDIAAAARRAEQLCNILKRQHGPEDWRFAAADHRREHLHRILHLSEVDRRKFENAEVELQEAFAAIRDGKDVRTHRGPVGEAMSNLRDLLGTDDVHYLRRLLESADMLMIEGDIGTAEASFSEILATNHKLGLAIHPLSLAASNRLGQIAQHRASYASAERCFGEATVVSKKLFGQSSREHLISLSNLATAQLAQHQFAIAQKNLLRAAEIAKEYYGEESLEYALTLNNLGGLYQNVGDLSSAERVLRDAHRIRLGALGDSHADTLATQNNLGGVQFLSANYDQAERTFRRLLEVYQTSPADHLAEIATTMTNLAATVEAGGDTAGAASLYENALSIREDHFGDTHPIVADSCNNLAMLHVSENRFGEAETLLERARGILAANTDVSPLTFAITLNNFAVLRRRQARYQEAAELYEKSLLIYEQLIRSPAASLPEREQISLTRHLRRSLDGYLSVAPHAQIDARSIYQRVLNWKGRSFVRQRALRLDTDNPQSAELLAQLDAVTARLAAMSLEFGGNRDDPSWRSEYSSLYATRERLEAQFAGTNVDDVGHGNRDTKSIQNALAGDQVLVDFLQYDQSVAPNTADTDAFAPRTCLTAFVVRRDAPIVRVELGDMSNIGKQVEIWLRTHGAAGKGATAGNVLRGMIWEPLAAHVEENDVVFISPDGPIALLPLAALPGDSPGTYLIQQHAFAIAPVAQLIGKSKPDADKEHDLLLIGDVDFGVPTAEIEPQQTATRFRFTPLENSRSEILAVADSHQLRFPDAARSTLRKQLATETRFREQAPRNRYLHIATHGFANVTSSSTGSAWRPESTTPDTASQSSSFNLQVDPQFLCGIALAGANTRSLRSDDDGILSAAEVAGLDLRDVDLAVLSACDTGRGNQAAGEGTLSLQRAFQIAGARSVVAALWKVDDRSTRLLIEHFYENLWNDQPPMTKIEALRQAQLSLLRGAGHRGVAIQSRPSARSTSETLPPFFWAAFVLSGDAGIAGND